MSQLHRLKTIRPFWGHVASGAKSFEIRLNDRDFKVGDKLELIETYDIWGSETGKVCWRDVAYVLFGGRFGLERDFVCLGFSDANVPPKDEALADEPRQLRAVKGRT